MQQLSTGPRSWSEYSDARKDRRAWAMWGLGSMLVLGGSAYSWRMSGKDASEAQIPDMYDSEDAYLKATQQLLPLWEEYDAKFDEMDWEDFVAVLDYISPVSVPVDGKLTIADAKAVP